MRRVDSLEKTLMLGGIGGRRRRGRHRMWWLDGITDSMDMSTWVWVSSRSWWWTGRPGVLWFMGSQRVGHDWATKLNWTIDTAERIIRDYYKELYTNKVENLEETLPKDVLFHYRGLDCTGKYGIGEQNEGGQRLIKFCQENTRFIANNFFQHCKRRL